MKYVAVLDVKNNASFLICAFKGAIVGELAANETAEGVTFFRATSRTVPEQLAYFAKIHEYLLTKEGRGLDAAVIPRMPDHAEADEFSAGIQKIGSSILLIEADNKDVLKSALGIDPTFDDGRSDPTNPHMDAARRIRNEVAP